MTRNKKAAKTAAPVVSVKETPAAEVKVAPAVEEKEEVKAVSAEEKKEVKTAPAAEKEAKASAKKTVKTTTKTAEKKEEPEKGVKVFLEYEGKQYAVDELIERAKAAAAEDAGLKRLSSIKTINIYCKPEDKAVYYVANGEKIVGHINL